MYRVVSSIFYERAIGTASSLQFSTNAQSVPRQPPGNWRKPCELGSTRNTSLAFRRNRLDIPPPQPQPTENYGRLDGAARKQLIFVGSLHGNENEELMDEG